MFAFAVSEQVGNAGNVVTTSGRHVIAGYHGEGYRSFQASQFMHFYDDGLFIGQFGTPNTDIFNNLLPTETVLTGPVEFTLAGYTAGVLAGFAGNAMSPVLVKAPNGITYLYVNDEWGYGPQRWRIDGLDTVQEFSGTGTLGGSITLSD